MDRLVLKDGEPSHYEKIPEVSWTEDLAKWLKETHGLEGEVINLKEDRNV